jgi:hypothetical protein
MADEVSEMVNEKGLVKLVLHSAMTEPSYKCLPYLYLFPFIYIVNSKSKASINLAFCRNMKTKLSTTYPDAFPEDSMSKVIDRRPDLEMPK